MSDHILIDGDLALFMPVFGVATVVPRPGALRASGPATLNGRKICVAGDESSVVVTGCAYFTAQHPLPGSGTLTIAALGADQKAKKTRSGRKPCLLNGSSFTARFEVQSPAQQPGPPPVLDATPQYSGSGSFSTTNVRLRGI